MIPESTVYTNNAGASITIGDTTYPLKSFNMPVGFRNNQVSRMQNPGQWPTYSYPDHRKFFFGGDILGDSASDYNDKLGDFREVIMPPFRVYSARRHGYLTMKFYGDATYYYIAVIVENLDTPKEANYPSVGTYELNFHAFEPYFRTGSLVGAPTVRY